ncbi:hypothetical protein JXA40_10225 [bacterium]|nr:hypothetical protein [candidate division CSSED10-310 bacterium]
MVEQSHGSFLKGLGILLAILIGIALVVYVGIPVLKFGLAFIWVVSGVIAFLLKLIIFIVFCVAVILSLIMLISWLIREFTD